MSKPSFEPQRQFSGEFPPHDPVPVRSNPTEPTDYTFTGDQTTDVLGLVLLALLFVIDLLLLAQFVG